MSLHCTSKFQEIPTFRMSKIYFFALMHEMHTFSDFLVRTRRLPFLKFGPLRAIKVAFNAHCYFKFKFGQLCPFWRVYIVENGLIPSQPHSMTGFCD